MPISSAAGDAETIAEDPPSAPNMIRFGPEQGVSRSVNDLAIDNMGFVWIATADGLARYDGVGFKRWQHDPKRKDSLPSSNVMSLYADSKDRIWAATLDSLSVLDKDRGGFRHIRFEKDEKPCKDGISVMKEIGDGVMWIGTLDGNLCRLDPNGSVRRYSLKYLFIDAGGVVFPISMYEDSFGTLWVGTNTGLLRFNNGKFDQNAKLIMNQEEISAISPLSKTEFWVGSDKTLYRMSVDSSILERKNEFSGGAIVVQDNRAGLWIGTALGLYGHPALGNNNYDKNIKFLESRYDRRGKNKESFERIKKAVDVSVFLMQKDKEGGLWIVGDVQGLIYLSPNNYRFVAIDSFGGFDADWHDVVAVSGDRMGRSWLLTGSSIYRISSKEKGPEISIDLRSLGVFGPRALEVCFGKILIADREGVVELNFDANRSKRLIQTSSRKLFGSPARIRCSQDRKIWISFFGGDLESYSEDGRLLYAETAEKIFGHSTPGIVELSFDAAGTPWYTDDTDMFRWSSDQFLKISLPAKGRVSAFSFRGQSELWVSRLGVLESYRWDSEKLVLMQRIDERQGMPSVDVEGMKISQSGSIWLTTMRGLLLYDPKQNRARLFGIHDGLPGTDFYYGPPVLLGQNRAVALSADGLAFFDPELGLEPAKPSLLSVESLSLRRDGGERALDPSRPVRMLAGDRDLRVVPRLLSFSDPQSHRYRSRMHGEDPDWVLQQGPSERVFSRLPLGRYTLELQAANADGAWSKPVKLSIEVMPPWWRTAWALAAYVLLISAFLWWLSYLYRLRLKRRHTYQLARQKRELAEQASDAKSRFLADLGHELRTPMTGVLGMSELLLASGLDPRQHGQVQSIRRAGEHLLRLVDDALDLARVEAGRLELQRIEFGLNASIDEIAGLMSPLAARKGLRFSVERDRDMPERWIGDPLRLKQIVLNLLGNAVKFTERGSVGLRIAATGRSLESRATGDSGDARAGLRIEIWDTGPGMNGEQVGRLFRRFEQAEGARTTARYGGTGLGLAISRELAVAMGGDIEVRSVPGEGTTFVLTLPLHAADAHDVEISGPATVPSMPAPIRWCVVLLVEDDPTVAEVLTGLLQAKGHRVVHAAHGLAAMTEAAVGRFDAAFVDLDLPGIDGCALAEQLRAGSFAAPMIAITARADAQAESQAKAAGFVGFLRKPTTGERLEIALRRALATADADSTEADSTGRDSTGRDST